MIDFYNSHQTEEIDRTQGLCKDMQQVELSCTADSLKRTQNLTSIASFSHATWKGMEMYTHVHRCIVGNILLLHIFFYNQIFGGGKILMRERESVTCIF